MAVQTAKLREQGVPVFVYRRTLCNGSLNLRKKQPLDCRNTTFMPAENHSQIASFIWSICNLLRGPYKRNEYRKVILPLTVLRRFDCLLAPTKAKVLAEHKAMKGKSENIISHRLKQIAKHQFYNLSKLDMPKLLDDPGHLAQ